MYRLLSETTIPYHEGDEHVTTIRMYDVDNETREFLSCVLSYQRDDGTYGPNNPAPDEVADAVCVEAVVIEALDLHSNGYVAPGAPYHTYSVTYWEGVVMVSDTLAYNV